MQCGAKRDFLVLYSVGVVLQIIRFNIISMSVLPVLLHVFVGVKCLRQEAWVKLLWCNQDRAGQDRWL